jgi:hypothetical protein
MSLATIEIARYGRSVGAFRGVQGRGWLDAVSDGDLRLLRVHGYRPPQQSRTVETTRGLLRSAWAVMVGNPHEPVQLQHVLEHSGLSSSSFYARFDSLQVLVDVVGRMLLDARCGAELPSSLPLAGAVGPQQIIDWATTEALGPLAQPTCLPREVLALGSWSEGYVSARRVARDAQLDEIADAVGARAAVPERDAARFRSWLQLVSGVAEQAWAVAALVVDSDLLQLMADRFVLLGRVLFAPDPATWDRASELDDVLPDPIEPHPLRGHSDRHAVTVSQFRDATRHAIITDGLDFSVGDLAASVHRAPSAYFDTFGSVGLALADLAVAEQTCRIPTPVFRPRPDVPTAQLLAHLARRSQSWVAQQQPLNRRLLQLAGRHRELAAVLTDQLLRSSSMLTSWYTDRFVTPLALNRLVFIALVVNEQHQGVWGEAPPRTADADAVADLFSPLLRAD